MEPQAAQRQTEWVIWEAAEQHWDMYARELGIHPLTARILAQRGIHSVDAAHAFLNPTLGHLHDPFLMKGMDEAVHQVLRALDRGEHIVIHGDYDVDGVCSVSLLYEFLRNLGARVGYFIPRRDQDGYGLNASTVQRLHAQGTSLIITTDCGISNHDEVVLARQLGMRVVIVDHHMVPAVMPPADAILNPLQPGCAFPFKSLAAVGVTFNLVIALRKVLRNHGVFRHVPEPDLRDCLDLVALGTVADVVPLVDENRIFVSQGLEVLERRRRAGISALMERAVTDPGPIGPQTISYRLAPRINAAGRMGDASICVELLTTSSYARAIELVGVLEGLNKERQELEKRILAAAMAQAEEQVALRRRILVLAGEDWNRGVLGIVASRIVERFHRPAVLLGIERGLGKGSARSIDGINVVDVLRRASEYLESYGGHAAAAGLSVTAPLIEPLRERMEIAMTEALLDGALPNPMLHIDSIVSLGELDNAFLRDLERLGPFGMGNREPVLLARAIQAVQVRLVGRNHVKARFRQETTTLDGIGFSLGNAVPMLGEEVSVAFVPRLSHHRGRTRIEMHVRDIRLSGDLRPDRIQRV